MPRSTTLHRYEAIASHVDALQGLAESLTYGPGPDFAARFDEELAFIAGTLLPHVDAVESQLYPELDRILADSRGMGPMRLEHREVRRLAGSLARYQPDVDAAAMGSAESLGLRRALYRLYAILKVHLAEEDLYLDVLDRNLPAERLAALTRAVEEAAAQPL